MSTSLNKVTIIGNLGDHPKIHYYDSQKCITRFRVATNETLKRSDGTGYTHTEWHTVVIKNSKLAEFCHTSLHKGDKVYIEGKIRSRNRQSNEGERKVFEILCLELFLLSSKYTKSKLLEEMDENAPNLNSKNIDADNLDDLTNFFEE